jgi:chemosensory pili system protein ChpA (sensor histidine kinase/response regulator)
LDESLYGIFAPECRKQLEVLSRFSTAIAKQSTGVDPGLVQVLYDLATSAKMAEIEPIAKLAKAAERCFALMQTFGLAPSAQDVSLLSRVLNELSALLAMVNVSGATMPDWRPLLVELESRLVQLEVETSAVDSSFKLASMETRVEPWRRSEQDTLMISEDPFLEAMGMTANHSESTSAASRLAQGAGDSAPSSYIPMPGAGSVDELEDFVAEDQELLEIFLEEAKDLGEKMDIALQAWLDNADDKAAMDQLKRVLHTLKGASRLAGVLQIGDLSHAYESFFIAIEHGSLVHSGQIDQIARQVGDFLLWQIESLDSSGKIPSSRGWLDTLGAAQRGEFSGQGRPIPLGTDSKILSNQGAPWPETQESLAELIPKEGQAGLDVAPVWPDVPEPPAPGDGPSTLDIQGLDATELYARQDPAEVLSLEDELKALEGLDSSWSETAKGPVGTPAITVEADLAPPWPDSADRLDAQPFIAQADRTSGQNTHQLDREAQPAASTKSAFARVDVLSLEEELKSLEGLGELSLPPLELEPVKTRLEAQAAELPGVEQLSRVPQASPRPDMEAKPSSDHAFEPMPEPAVKPEAAIPIPTPGPGPQAPPRARVSRPAEPSAEAQAKQELVRVRADRLDQMVNSAGEISIFRARIEQQSGIIGFNLEELNQTLYRLRNQLRRLEIETEAQIQFRFDQVREEGTAPDASFDPLEMDRFSSMQQVSRALTETLDDLINLKDVMVETNRTTDTLLLQQSRVNNDLQDSLLRTRMVSFSQAVPRLQRLVRQTAQGLGKKGELQVEGGGGELDRSILDRILAPLEHILRNALSHGIETPDERRQQGKNETGRIVLSLLREGKDMLVRVEDDGAGINTKAIRKKAIERGLLEPDAQVTEDELIQFLLESGFSTASQVTQVSGRGVGMDVVVSEVKQLGGVLDISSNPGKGTRFDIRLPFTLSLTETLLVGVGDDIFAVPHTSIEGVIRMSREQLDACYLGVQEGVSYAGNAYRVRYLAELLGFVETGANFFPEERKWYPMLLVRHGELRIAIHADRMLGSRQIVVKSVGAQLSAVRWITGGTILADGRVALILDVTTLVRLSIRSQARILRPGEDSYLPVPRVEVAPTLKATVMVVDDSVTVRKVTGRLLSRHNLNVVTAKDGVDALDQLQNLTPDVMLLDIEMPRMDGYELTRHIRHDTKLKRIPIIMITSRTGDKHRQMAMDLGVNLYLGKPFQEAELLESIRSLLPEEFQDALH